VTELEKLESPRVLDALDHDGLRALAAEIRAFLIDRVARTGGHIGANLGTVELSIALHRAFRSPRDKILFDTGHQGYTHKILTGRAGLFPTLNTYGGLGRFLSRAESEHDPIEASHAGTSISVALGMALARRIRGEAGATVAVIGDGSLAEGLAFEALNHAAVEESGLVVVINDNGFAISPGFGGLHEALQAGGARAAGFFEALGCEYVGPVDGHDIPALLAAFERAKAAQRLPVVHAKTEKGHGWEPAGRHPLRQHFSFAFDPATGQAREAPGEARGALGGPTFPEVAAQALERCMERDEAIVCITPSTLYATGLAPIFERYPARCFDPGMEEQHALTLTVGMALEGLKPVIAYQSTFLQRAFDQLVHDVCFTGLPTLILAVRSGFSGYDNPTHHGIYDFAYLRGLPNLVMLYPKDRYEAERMVEECLRDLRGPTMILMPYGPAPAFDPAVLEEPGSTLFEPQVVEAGRELCLFAVGHKFAVAREVVRELRAEGVACGLVNLRRLKPLPEEALAELLAEVERAVVLEEAVLDGGVGSAIAALVTDRSLQCELLRVGLPCAFVEPGSNAELERAYGLDARGVREKIAARWSELGVALV